MEGGRAVGLTHDFCGSVFPFPDAVRGAVINLAYVVITPVGLEEGDNLLSLLLRCLSFICGMGVERCHRQLEGLLYLT